VSLKREFAGAEQVFSLDFGAVMDLEEACGKTPIGVIYKRVVGFDFRAKDIFEILRLGLIGGGIEAAEARRLVQERLDAAPLAPLAELACSVLLNMMDGAPESEGPVDGELEPFDAGQIYQSFAQVGIPPQQVNAMRVGDALRLFEAARRKKSADAPSDAELDGMAARVASGALDWALKPTSGEKAN